MIGFASAVDGWASLAIAVTWQLAALALVAWVCEKVFRLRTSVTSYSNGPSHPGETSSLPYPHTPKPNTRLRLRFGRREEGLAVRKVFRVGSLGAGAERLQG
jgi:hypothetical protein